MVEPNILIIVVDTLREDSSEILWAMLENRGFSKLGNVISTSSWTTPSHASMFTGQHPSVHGAHTTKDNKIDSVKLKSDDQLTHDLKGRGYRCHLLSANPYISNYYGFTGFDDQYEILYTPEMKLISHAEWDLITYHRSRGASPIQVSKALLDGGKYSLVLRSGLQKAGLEAVLNKFSKLYGLYIRGWPKEKGVKRILSRFGNLAKSLRKDREFVFINLMEAHEPYLRNRLMKYVYNFNKEMYEKDINEGVLDRLKEAYRKEIAYITGKLAKMLDMLEKHGRFQETLVIITSDHGQLFGEHGKLGHGVFLYDELLRVPMFIKYPKSVKVERTGSGPEDYISLIKLREFLTGSLDRGVFDERGLISDHAIAESHGINIELRFPHDKAIVEDLDKLRLSIHYKNAQGIFNVSSWKFDLLTSFDGKEVDDETAEEMKKRIVAHVDHFTRIKLLRSKIGDLSKRGER